MQKTKVLRNTNFKLNNGFLDYSDVAEIEVEKTQLATRTLQYGDIILEKSGGSDTQAIGRVVLFDKTDNETYSYSNFCSRIRVQDDSQVNPIYLWIILYNFYCKGGTIPLQNGIMLSLLNYADSTLNTIAPFATKSIKYSDIESETYITTDNMLQNKLGGFPFEGVANISSITEYKPKDILISNIRPYLKKIWFADKEGGCSKDVLVLRSADTSKYLPKYIFYMIRRDTFFDYVMEGKKGIKMPRGNKEDIMKYKIPMPHIDEQKRIVSQIEALELEITKARILIENAASEKQAILDKYL